MWRPKKALRRATVITITTTNIATEIALIAIAIRHTALDLSGLDLWRAKLQATRLTLNADVTSARLIRLRGRKARNFDRAQNLDRAFHD